MQQKWTSFYHVVSWNLRRSNRVNKDEQKLHTDQYKKNTKTISNNEDSTADQVN